MLMLIEAIDYAWKEKQELYDINPCECNGYFDFRNKVVIQYENENTNKYAEVV